MPVKHFIEFARLFPEPLILVNPKAKILAANLPAAQFFDFPDGELQGKLLADLLTDPKDKVLEYLKSCSSAEQFVPCSFSFIDKNKTEKSFITECVLYDPGSKNNSYLIRIKTKRPSSEKIDLLNKEIKDLNISETALKKSEQRLDAIFEQAGMGIVQADLAGNIIMANRKFSDMIGRPLEELQKLQIRDITHPDDLTETSAVLNRVIYEGEKLEMEKRYIMNDGSFIWVSISVSLMKDMEGTPLYLLAFVNDITDAKKAKEALLESEVTLDAIFKQATIGIAQTDLQGKFLMINEKYSQIVGRTHEELMNMRLLDITHSEDIAASAALLSKAVKEGKSFIIEKRYLLPDGSVVWVNKSVSAIKSPTGEIKNIVAVIQDITDRKLTEEKLTLNENKLSALVGQAAVGITQLDLKGNYFFANTQYCDIVGRDLGDILTLKIHDITHPDDLERNLELFRKTVEEGEDFVIEKRYIKPDGSIVWVNKSVSLIKDLDGKPMFVTAIVQDISQNKKIQEQLRLNENRITALIDQASVGITQIDLNGRYFFANDRYSEITGRNIDELLTLKIHDITHPDDLPRNLELFKKTVEEGVGFIIEKRYIKPDGSIVWVNKSVSLVTDEQGKPMFVTAIVQDITDSKRLQDELRLNENRLSSLIDQAAVGITQMDLNGRYFFANERYSDIVGREMHELLTLKIHDITHPEDLPRNLDLFQKMIDDGTGFVIEKRYIKPDSSIVWVNKSVSLVTDEEGKPMFVTAVVQDITDRKLAEKALLEAHKELEDRVEERTIELALSNEDLRKEIVERKNAEEKLRDAQKELIQSEKLAALGRIATNIAHEIRNPLANISASSQYIMKKFNADPKINSLLDIVVRNTEAASNKIKELLDFASPRELKMTEGNIMDSINKVTELINPRCLKNNVDCKIISPADLPIISYNAQKIEEALLNLLTNSFDAMPDGGSLNIKTSYDKPDKQILITIQDTGEGIAPENIDKIYEPFFTTKHTGIGLGLSLVHQIIQLHDGRMKIQSIQGKGTTVEISLPVVKT